LVGRLSPVDLVLVEGFKSDSHPKLEVHRVAAGKDLIHPRDPHVRAIVTDAPDPFPIEHFGLNDVEAIANWILSEAAAVT